MFSGDTAVCPELVELARGADVLLADTAWVDRGSRPDNLHMSGREAAGVAVEAGVGRLLLTHVLPWSDRDAVLADAASVFPDRAVLVDNRDSHFRHLLELALAVETDAVSEEAAVDGLDAQAEDPTLHRVEVDVL